MAFELGRVLQNRLSYDEAGDIEALETSGKPGRR